MRRRLSPLIPDLAIFALLLLLPLILFWPQTVGGRTLLPAENLYQFEPYATDREQAGAPAIPHNHLLSDLVLQNMHWKAFIRESIAEREIPLWNPHQFAGVPFLAAGQQSTLYPFSLLYYALPLPAAYGWFTVIQLWLAGAFMFLFARGLGVGRAGGLTAGITYQLSALFVTSAVFPMIIGSAAWLPLLLLMIEWIVRQRPALRGRPSSLPWVAIGAIALGCSVLAGHVEITYYTLIIMAYYAAARLIAGLWTRRRAGEGWALRWAAERAVWLLVLVVLGMGLGAIQFLPLFELANINFRSGSASLQQVLDWAHPFRDLVQFALPNFYGSPAHHSYVDVFSGQTVSLIDNVITNAAGGRIVHTEWGMKNYVEAALYIGILPLALATFALLTRRGAAATRWIFAGLAVFALTVMFGLPTYALLYYTLPGIDQLHSPFRWVFALTLSVAVLAGLGMDALTSGAHRRAGRRLALVLTAVGALTLAALVLSRLLYAQIEGLVTRLYEGMARAAEAFSDARMFYSYQFGNMLIFGVVTLAAGLIVWWIVRAERRRWLAALTGALLIALDLMIASWGFNPASDPALLDYTPPAITWLQQQTRGGDHFNAWRFTTLDDPTQPPLLQANIGMRYGLDDVRGYESIIPRQYVDFMAQLAPQVQLEYNRVAPLYTSYSDGFDPQTALTSPLLDLLNVRYVVTHASTSLADVPGYALAYEDDAVRIWENADALPRAFVSAIGDFDGTPPQAEPAAITSATGREKLVDLEIDGPAQLVVLETNTPGWRAYLRPQGAGEDAEAPLEVELYAGNFQRVTLPEAGAWTVRLVYSPASFQIGLFISFISGLLLVFALGVWLWRLYVNISDDVHDRSTTAARVAKNSIAPIVLNLFNRGIDFAFAFVMLRILGPEDAGVYFYAGVIFMWFDIITNFGLNLYLTREVARDHSQAGRILFNTSALRVLLMIVSVPLLLGFLGVRQSAITPPLSGQALLAIGLLYVGLLPNSLSNGLSALFYAFEKAEVPAAVATVATMSKALFGLVALILGYGVVGLAAVSILTNVVTLAILSWNGRALFGLDRIWRQKPERGLMGRMVGQSWPLMLNHFLATIFFQIDVVLIEAIHNPTMVGQYSVAYKWVSALNIIPSFFTQALLPVMSRQAHEDRAALKRNYIMAIKLLVVLALPVAVGFTFLAEFLTGLLGGAEYLPDGAIATRLMIWSIPIGWMNSLTQYMLIALDMQRRITLAFALGVGFNLITNLIFIPQFGYQAAALTTIASELVLFIPFALLMREALGPLPWLQMLWRPVIATAAMIAATALLWGVQPVLALVAGTAVYGGVLLTLRPFTQAELNRLLPLLPVKRLRPNAGADPIR